MVPWEGGGRVQWKQELVAAGLSSSLWWKGFLGGVHRKESFLTHVSIPQEEELCIVTASRALEQSTTV